MAWTHFRDERGRARSLRRCDLCCEMIQPEEMRVKRFGVDSGKFVRMDMHLECDAQTHGWDEMQWECFSPGDIIRPKGGE